MNIQKIVSDKIRHCNKCFQDSKDKKWIHIVIVLKSLFEELTGNEYIAENYAQEKDLDYTKKETGVKE